MIGEIIELRIGAIANGGHCVARLDGRVVFVRHTLPGELVRARITGEGGGGKYLRADAIDIIEASPDRVTPPCRFAGECGGCDWQHVALDAQRRGKAGVVRELLRDRVDASLLDALEVRAVRGDADGLGWRTRVRFAVDAQGRAGLRGVRSHDVVSVDSCAIAHPQVNALGITAREWSGVGEVLAVAPSEGSAVSKPDPKRGDGRVRETAAGRNWRVDLTGFWQVHPGAPDSLVDVVRSMAAPRAGERLLDLYSGVGLFAGALAGDVTTAGQIDAVESDAGACTNAKRNLHDLPQVRLHHGDVLRWLRSERRTADAIVLDPPRTGAGPQVVEKLVEIEPRVIVYVACEPAPLARDLAVFAERGWHVREIAALDMFPMTHHVECVVQLTR